MTFGVEELVDVVIVFTLLECAALVAYRRLSGKGVALRDFIVNMVSGVCLMLALRCAVRDAGSVWIALFLVAAGGAHGLDIWMRWRRSEAGATVTRRMVA
jgi:hypothetical protein